MIEGKSGKNNINFSSFDPFNTSKKMVDKYKINYIDVKKNESLFIPSGWWHSVLYLKNSFSLSIMDLC